MAADGDRETLGYSFNFFPGESLAQIREALDVYGVPVKREVFPDDRLGLELRFGLGAIRELADPAALLRLREDLESRGLFVFTLNGFPIGDFHGDRVKEEVFRPTWLDEERIEATQRLGEIAAALLGEADEGSVSTHPGSFKGWGDSPETREAIVRNLARVACHFARIAEETGKRILLCVEPEPLGTFENLDEAIALFELADHCGAYEARRCTGRSLESARTLLREFLALNFDTCHFSVEFEEPESSLARLDEAGVRIGKMHLSNGLRVDRPGRNPEGMALLRDLDEPRYLHQVVGVGEDGRVALREADLEGLFARPAADLDRLRELRVHFHLPLFFEGGGGCGSTSAETGRAYRTAREAGLTRAFAIETYTWDILRAKKLVEVSGIVEGLVREFRWAIAQRT